MLLGLLLTLNILVCLALVGVVLLQRSEGGALGTGGPTGLITTRGAGDLLTRTTWVLFTLFLLISLALTLLGGRERSSQAILNRLKNQSINPDALALPSAPRPASPAAAPPAVTLPTAPPAAAIAPVAPPPARTRPLTAPTPTVRVLPAPKAAPGAPTPAASPPASATPSPVAAPTPKIEVTPPPLAVPPPPAPKEAAPQTPPAKGAP
jgi:preprotein translocase subunit SecG